MQGGTGIQGAVGTLPERRFEFFAGGAFPDDISVSGTALTYTPEADYSWYLIRLRYSGDGIAYESLTAINSWTGRTSAFV
jgi:hypothetical protein